VTRRHGGSRGDRGRGGDPGDRRRGDPSLSRLQLQRLLREGAAPPTVVAPDEVPDDALIVTVGGMGAPTVGIERLARGDEWTVALRTLERHLGRRTD